MIQKAAALLRFWILALNFLIALKITSSSSQCEGSSAAAGSLGQVVWWPHLAVHEQMWPQRQEIPALRVATAFINPQNLPDSLYCLQNQSTTVAVSQYNATFTYSCIVRSCKILRARFQFVSVHFPTPKPRFRFSILLIQLENQHQVMPITTSLIDRTGIFQVLNVLKESSVIYQCRVNRFMGVRSHSEEQFVEVCIYE